jgi:hypothetical protein
MCCLEDFFNWLLEVEKVEPSYTTIEETKNLLYVVEDENDEWEKVA